MYAQYPFKSSLVDMMTVGSRDEKDLVHKFHVLVQVGSTRCLLVGVGSK